jgi:predicted nucleic acid-binding protein
MLVVLDTNVWLDALVFEDALATSLIAAIRQREARIAIDAATVAELVFVLERLAAVDDTTASRRERAVSAAQALSAWMKSDFSATHHSALNTYTHRDTLLIANNIVRNQEYPNDSIASVVLPRCRDKADQMFLELASYARAQLLITHDKKLLKCRRYRLIEAVDETSHGTVITPSRALAVLA